MDSVTSQLKPSASLQCNWIYLPLLSAVTASAWIVVFVMHVRPRLLRASTVLRTRVHAAVTSPYSTDVHSRVPDSRGGRPPAFLVGLQMEQAEEHIEAARYRAAAPSGSVAVARSALSGRIISTAQTVACCRQIAFESQRPGCPHDRARANMQVVRQAVVRAAPLRLVVQEICMWANLFDQAAFSQPSAGAIHRLRCTYHRCSSLRWQDHGVQYMCPGVTLCVDSTV
jgi:hypothetical protein